RGAVPRLPVGADLATVASSYALDQRQSDAGPRELLRRMQSLEDPEDLVDVAHVEACAVVLHEVRDLATLVRGADLDPRPVGVGAELDGVGQQVDEELLDEVRITVSGRQVADDELDLAG